MYDIFFYRCQQQVLKQHHQQQQIPKIVVSKKYGITTSMKSFMLLDRYETTLWFLYFPTYFGINEMKT